MSFQIQTFHAESGFYLNTNHKMDDLDELKQFASSSKFFGFKIRIVDENGDAVFIPTVDKRETNPSISDIAEMFGVPVVEQEDPQDFLDQLDD